MSDKKRISSLKEFLRKGRNAPRDHWGWIEDLEMHSNIIAQLTNIGRDKIYELAEEVYLYLDDPYSEFRVEAVKTLGWNTRLGIDEFCKNQAFKIWEQDPNEDVRVVALGAWSNYYAMTKNKDVLQKLYDILVSEKYYCRARAWALEGFLRVSSHFEGSGRGYDFFALCDLKEHEEFNKAVDWNRVSQIMTECVPGWEGKIIK
jgi:hypothetical protein